MNIVDKNNKIAPGSGADLDSFRLRRFIDELSSDELEVRKDATDLADVAQVLEGNPRAVLFEAAGPERQQLVGGVGGSRSRIARALGVAPDELRENSSGACATNRRSSRSRAPKRRRSRWC